MSETCHKLIKYLLEVGWRIAVFTDPNVAPMITKSEKLESTTVVRTAEITCDDVITLVQSGAIVEASRSDEAVLYRLAERDIPQRATQATVAQIEAQVKQVRREAE